MQTDRLFAVGEQGQLQAVSSTRSSRASTRPFEEKCNWQHVNIYDLSDGHSLLLDSFNDALLIAPTEIAQSIVGDPSNLSPEVLNLAHSIFSRNSNEWRNALVSRARQHVADRKKHLPIVFSIVPSYSCNMVCTYCFQQGHLDATGGVIDAVRLEAVFDRIRSVVYSARAQGDTRDVNIHLFGGEPFMSGTEKIIERVFRFGRDHRFFLSATTNGLELDRFWKHLGVYAGYLARIVFTLDGCPEVHDTRRTRPDKGSTFNKIMENIRIVLQLGIRIGIRTNLDRTNAPELCSYLEILRAKGLTNNVQVDILIGRVYNRSYDDDHKGIMTESEFLNAINEASEAESLPSNLRVTDIHTCDQIARRFGVRFGNDEPGRGLLQYCHAVSPTMDKCYIDSDLRLYRCPVVVGRAQWAIGELNNTNRLTEPPADWLRHNLLDIEECWECPIGGYCRGGCLVSSRSDWERFCREERNSFDCFVDSVVLPRLRARLAQAPELSSL